MTPVCRKPCLCRVCPHCKRAGEEIQSQWVLSNPALKELWFAAQFCPRCGSRWSAWHWLEQRVGMHWRRVYALNPGIHELDLVTQFVWLQWTYRHQPEKVR